MTIPATTRKAGPFTGNGSNTAFPFTFKVFTATDVAVIKADVDGVESTLTLDSDYSVTLNSDQDATPGGTVTYPISGSPLPSTDKLSIKGDVDYQQGTDIPTGGDFNPVVLENALDSLSMQIQQVQEAVSRAAVVPITSAADAEALVADIALLASKIDNLDTIFAGMADITTVADDLNEPVSEIETVAGSITNVNIVGANIADVNAVAANETNVDTVAGISANVTTVAGIAANVTTVAGISANVTSVAGNATNINAVAANEVNIDAVAANETNIDAAVANATNINAVVANETNIDTVAGIAANVTTVAGIAANVTAVAGNATNINAVAANETNIDAVAGNATNINAVAADATDIGVVATNIAAVSTVATDIASVNSAAANMAAILDAPAQASAAAASAAAAAASLDNFDDRYLGSKASAPTLDNDGNALVAGALYFNNGTIVTDDKGMWVYDGGTWIAASAASQAILVKYKYVATAGQTSFSGTDANGLTLSYTAGSIIVTLNGVVMDAADYTATSGNSVVLGTAAALNDELGVFAFSTFDIANTYTQAQVDAFAVKLTGAQTIAGVKTFSDRPLFSGGIDLNANGQIKFPATQNASADANTLDDYEEGTWSPTWAAGGGSATASSSGMYTKVGRLVTVNFKTTFSSASAYFNPYITNLPFPIATSINDSSGVVREYALTGLFWGLNYGSGTAVSMNRYDNSNTIPNGAPAFAGTFTYQTA